MVPYIQKVLTGILLQDYGEKRLYITILAIRQRIGYSFGSLPEISTWTLEIINALTGTKVISQQVYGSSCEIDTSCMSKGVYVIRATVGDEVLSEKIVIR